MINELKQLEKEGLITLRPNDSNTLLIANYTPKVQYDKLWTETLMQCRGLIVDLEGNIVARPFPKFFNIEEHDNLPNEEFEVYDKMDGSLGILYVDPAESKWKIATRGSFNSEQALKATKMLYEKYEVGFHTFYTYLFEIIYPSNRIVCDYGQEERLVLLAMIDNRTGKDVDISESKFPDKVKRYDGIRDVAVLKTLEEDNKEGFVIKYRSGLRIKVKFEEYVRLHRILTQVNARTIWEYLKDGKSPLDLALKVPDEFYNYVRTTAKELNSQFVEIKDNAKYRFKYNFRENRKEFATLAKFEKYPSLQFMIYDNKPTLDEAIWSLIKPQHDKPFKIEI